MSLEISSVCTCRFRQDEPTLFVDSFRKVGKQAGYSHPRFPTLESALLTHFLGLTTSHTFFACGTSAAQTTSQWLSRFTNSFHTLTNGPLSCSHVSAASGDFAPINLVATAAIIGPFGIRPVLESCAPPNWMLACCRLPDTDMAHHR